MSESIRYVSDIQIIKNDEEPDLMAIKAKGIALIRKHTTREPGILILICQEFSSQEIAEKLFIKFHTVESHRANLMQKAGVKNTAGLVRWTVENDFIN